LPLPDPKKKIDPDAGSIWGLKPWWCQPWSILLTGSGMVAISWWWPHRLWLTLGVAALVLLWWWLFLVVVPAAYRAEREAASEVRPPAA
jgi:membrane protein YdbS with pleckstrin-like domain